MITSITHSIKMLILVITVIVFMVPNHSIAQYNIKIAAHIVHSTNLGISGISTNDVATSISQVQTLYTSNNTGISFTLVSTDYLDDDNFVNVIRGTGTQHSQQASDLFNTFNQPGVIHVIYVPTLDHHGVAKGIPGRKIIMANNSATNNESLAHEIGHCFGLHHTYRAGEHVTRSGYEGCVYNATTAGDFVADTPADPMDDVDKEQTFINSQCQFEPASPSYDECGDEYIDPWNILVNNLMSIPKQDQSGTFYCGRSTLTSDQIVRMEEFLDDEVSDIVNTFPVTISNIFNEFIIPDNQNQTSTLSIDGITVSSGGTAYLNEEEIYTGRTKQERFNNYQAKNIKHNDWDDDPEVYHLLENFQISSSKPTKDAIFETMNVINYINAVAENILTINNDDVIIEFKDPWYIFPANVQKEDQDDAWIPNDDPNWLTGSYSEATGGIFLNEDYLPANPNKPYYSTRVPVSQQIQINNRQHTFYFQNWIGNSAVTIVEPNDLETPVVFNSENATISAILKGTQLSNDVDAYSTNSQRKFVRTDNGYLHSVYESMGKAWYEISTDGGLTWQIANNGQPLSGSKESKLPAIDYRGDYVIIVWQEYDVGAYDIKIAKFFAGTYQQEATIFMDIYLPYSSQTNPVIAWDDENKIIVMWKRDEDNYGYWPVGIVFKFVTLKRFGGWTEHDFGVIPTTNSNSINPTLVVDKDNTLNPPEYHLAWEQQQSGFFSDIKYFELYRDGYNQIQTQPPLSPEIPSSGAGFWTNKKPSIIVVDDHTPRLTWIGFAPWYGTRAVFRTKQTNGSWSSTVYNYGSNVKSVNINRTDEDDYAFGWSQFFYPDGYPNKYVKNSNLWTIYDFGTTGKDIQVCNAADFSSMYCLAFQSHVPLPYRFVQSSSFGYLEKPTRKTESIGRAAIVTKDSAEFIYALGDVLLNDEPIKFKDVKDTIQINSQQELNNYLKSKPFHLDDGSAFIFSVVSGVVNPLVAAMLLEEGKYVKFKVELIKDKTGEILNSFAILEYNANNVEELTNLSFSLNTSGMSKTKVHLKILLDENISGEYTLSELISEDSVLHSAKKGYQEVFFGGDLAVTEYALEQNYPNPFNPSTTLKYQIPQNGFVTLKIYDILGKEVATLVNEEKAVGRYEVNFNASSLASGVYLYRLNVNDYVNVKKMLMIK